MAPWPATVYILGGKVAYNGKLKKLQGPPELALPFQIEISHPFLFDVTFSNYQPYYQNYPQSLDMDLDY